MTAVGYELEIEWPIENADLRLADIRAEARASLIATLTHHHLTATSLPAWNLQHGQPSRITARLAVTGPAGMPTHIDATTPEESAAA